LIVPEARLFPSKTGFGFFGTKRFDRNNGKYIHMHSIAGLLHADHRQFQLDYETIMKATIYLTKDIRECEIQFRNAVFNILGHNRDDHSKNFSFLMDQNGSWRVSPAYDLTFSSGPMGEHSTMIMGEGKYPKIEHLYKMAAICNIKENKVAEIIHQVADAISKWHEFAKEAGVSKSQANNIQSILLGIRKNICL
jgi:serine/threonine-protein kinase HipA